jgi:hypothetical protein
LNEIIQQNKQLLEEKKKSELFLSAASPSNLEPKKSIKGVGKTKLGDPGAKKHNFDDSLIELNGPHQEEIQKQKEFISKTMDVVKDFEVKGAKPKIHVYGIPANKTEDKKMEKQHPTASTHIHDNLATADFVTQPLVSPIQNHLTLPPVLSKATTGVNNIHGMPPPQNQNTVWEQCLLITHCWNIAKLSWHIRWRQPWNTTDHG